MRSKEENKTLKVGAIAGPETELVEVAAKVAKEKYGLTVEVVNFSDYVTPNVALNDGSIDVNAFQHKPHLDAQIRDRGFKLVPVGNTFVYPIAGYSKKIKALSELKDGAQIAVPNDPTNLGRSLILLEKQGLLKLKEGAGLKRPCWTSPATRTTSRSSSWKLPSCRARWKTWTWPSSTTPSPARSADPDRERSVC